MTNPRLTLQLGLDKIARDIHDAGIRQGRIDAVEEIQNRLVTEQSKWDGEGYEAIGHALAELGAYRRELADD